MSIKPLSQYFIILALNGLFVSGVMYAASLQDVMEASRDRQWSRVSELAKDAGLKDEDKEYVAYLSATALFEAGENEKALQAYQSYLDTYKEGRWKTKAQYRIAECQVRLKRYEEAERIYSGGVKGTMNWKRRDELAGIFLAHGDKAYKPEIKGASPDYNKALLLYGHARDIYKEGKYQDIPEAFKAIGPRIEENLYRIAYCQHKLGQFNESLATSDEVRNFFYEKKEKGWVPRVADLKAARFADASLLRGECLLKMGNNAAARREWLHMEREIPDATQTAEAVYHISKTYGFPSPPNTEMLDLGVKTLRRFLEKYPQHKLAPRAAYDIADAYYNQSRFEEALQQFQSFLSQFGNVEDKDLVYLATKRVGDCQQRLERFDEAVAVWKKFLTDHPINRYWNEVQQSIIDVNYIRAETWLGQKKYDEAAKAYQDFLAQYPLDARNPLILHKLGDIAYRQEKYNDAITIWEQLVSKYPNHDEAWHAQFTIAQTRDEKLDDPEKALEEFAKVAGGNWKTQAEQRIREMKDKQLIVATRRAYRSDEKSQVRLTTRNIEKLTVKAYPLDMETYFRRLHTIRRVEDLDLSLIAPAKEWELPIESYKKYRVIEKDIDLPFENAGAWALIFGEEKLEAVTLVLKTDLQIIVKSSKGQAFVFAENVRTDKPYAGARLLLSDGSKILNEGKTNEDGVYIWESGDLVNVDNLSVLVLDGASGTGGQGVNIASNNLVLNNITAASGLQPRGIVYTDRPAYRPGDTVRFKSIIRLVMDGHYEVPSDKPFRVEVKNSRGALLYNEEKKASAFGTLDSEVTLAGASPLGDYRISISQKDGLQFEGSFIVAQFELPKLQIAFDLEKLTWFLGEEITGTIHVKEFSGQPAVKRQVAYRLQREWKTGTTDEKGEIPFTFETWDFDEGATLLLEARVDEARAWHRQPVLLVTTGFKVAVETNRSVYLAAEPFTVHLKAETHGEDAKPITKEFRVVVRTRRTDDPKLGWAEVRTDKVTTNEKGEADHVVTLDKGGEYEIRVEAEDDRGALIHAEKYVRVSDDEDKTKILVLADTDKLKLGDAPKLTVISRLPDGLALLTFEGEKVLRHQTIQLHKGKNEIPLSLDESFAPRFVFAAHIIQASAFYNTDKAFSVERELKVAVKVDKESYGPGDSSTLSLMTTDQNGKPVAAELSLALVDEALLAIYPDPIKSFKDTFVQSIDARFINTMSTADFSYAGVTNELSQDIIGEKKRIAISAEVPVMKGERARGMREGGGTSVEFYLDANEVAEAAASKPAAVGSGGQMLSGFEGSTDLALTITNGEMIPNQPVLGVPFVPVEELNDRVAGDRVARSRLSSDEKSLDYFDNFDADSYAFGVSAGKAGASYITIRSFFPTTAYWNASVQTNENGEGKVDVVLPDSLTTWHALGRGVTVQTLVGEGWSSVIARKDLSVEANTPALLTVGDETILTGVIKNHSKDKLSIESKLTAIASGVQSAGGGTIDIASGEIAHCSASLKISSGTDPVSVEFTAKSGNNADGVKASVPVRPWGAPLRVGRSGRGQDDQSIELKFPDGVPIQSPQMEIAITTGADRSLLDFVLKGEGFGFDSSSAELGRAALAVLEYYESAQINDPAVLDILKSHVRSAVRNLEAGQKEDGSWGTGPDGSRMDMRSTIRNVELLSQASKRGLTANPESVSKAASWLEGQYPQAEDNQKSLIVYGLSTCRTLDFAWLNRLHRMTSSLTDYSLVHLALAWENQERPEKAAEVLTSLVTRKPFEPKPFVLESRFVHDFGERGEMSALTTLALLRLGANTAADLKEARDKGIEALLARRIGRCWPSGPESQAVARALVEYLKLVPPAGNNYRLTVYVNEKTVQTLEVNGFHPAIDIVAPSNVLATDVNKIRLDMEGRGDYTYSIRLTGMTDDIAALNKWQEVDLNQLLHLERLQLPSPSVLPDGREIPRSAHIILDNQLNNPTVDEVQLGDSFMVHLGVGSHLGPIRNLVIEEPIPAGFRPITDKITGDYDRYEVQPGMLVFYCGAQETNSYFNIDYRLRADHAGVYRTPPTRVHLEGEPDVARVGKDYSISIFGPGQRPAKKYPLSPNEIYEMGLWLADHDDAEKAWPHLKELFDTAKLRPENLKEVATRLLKIALTRDDDAMTVKVFEVVKERVPDHPIAFEDVARIGEAYRRIKEFERAAYVERGLLGSLFIQEGNVSGILQSASEYAAAETYMRDLILQYPDLPDVETAVYVLGQLIYASVDKYAESESYKKLNLGRDALLDRAASYLESFLDLYPANPIADEVSFTLANIRLDKSEYDAVISMLERFEKRYPDSRFLDSYEFAHAFALFHKSKYEEALKLCDRVSTAEYKGDTGQLEASPDRYNALHMAGKINHAAGQLAAALDRYNQVKDRFTDASRAVEYLTATGLSVPEVTTVKTGEPAVVKVRAKNLTDINIRVYKVDLLTLALKERNLNNITGVNLAGITPDHAEDITLGEEARYDWYEKEITLPLDKSGSYLLVLKGGDKDATGMLLRSDLEMEVQEDLAGAVRANIRRAATDQFIQDVVVKVIGSADTMFKTGKTDLRGVFETDGIHGTATVVAKLGDEYSFHRGSLALAEAPKAAEEAVPHGAPAQSVQMDLGGDEQVLTNIRSSLRQIQDSNDARWYNISQQKVKEQKAESLY